MKRRFSITLESAGDGADPEGFQGLRRWLKAAWRCYSLKVIDYQTHPPLPGIGQPDAAAGQRRAGSSAGVE